MWVIMMTGENHHSPIVFRIDWSIGYTSAVALDGDYLRIDEDAIFKVNLIFNKYKVKSDVLTSEVDIYTPQNFLPERGVVTKLHVSYWPMASSICSPASIFSYNSRKTPGGGCADLCKPTGSLGCQSEQPINQFWFDVFCGNQ
jgi:hypothetical protein